MTVQERVFIGIFPAALVYADRQREEHGDYKRLAILPYGSLELIFSKDCPKELREYITADAAEIQKRRGEQFEISACGQTVLLGEIY